MPVGVAQNFGVAALARETGYAVPSVSQMLKAGQTPDQIRQKAMATGRSRSIVAAAELAAGGPVKILSGAKATKVAGGPVHPIGHGNGHSNGHGGGSSPDRLETYNEALARKERAMADHKELEVAQRRGDLVPVGQINAWFAGVIIKARDVLANIGPELADRLAQETDSVVIEELVTAEITRALEMLAVFGKRSGTHAV